MGPESVETAPSNLRDEETDTGQVTDGVAGATETLDEHLVILVAEGHATVTGHEARDSLVVFFELDSDTLSNTGVGLLRLDTDLLDDDAGGVRSALERLAPLGGLMSKLVLLVSPQVQPSLVLKLATSADTTRFMFAHVYLLLCEIRDLFINNYAHILFLNLTRSIWPKPTSFNN